MVLGDRSLSVQFRRGKGALVALQSALTTQTLSRYADDSARSVAVSRDLQILSRELKLEEDASVRRLRSQQQRTSAQPT
jgi:hypothetical protein